MAHGRCWTIIPSADPTQWTTQNGACKFLGVHCASPDAVLPVLPKVTSAIEFLGDSITASLRLLYAGAPWNPPVPPRIVVIYHGTNDTTFTEEQYHEYLCVIRTAYPRTDIFAICPHTKAHFASPIRAAAHQAGDHVWFCDYSNGVIAPADTSDGCHLNPSGAMRLAVRLAGDIAHLIRGNTASK